MDGHGSSGVMGTIGWEITEASSGETIHRGKRDVGPDDVEVLEVVRMPDLIRQARQVRSPVSLRERILWGAFSAVVRAPGAITGLVTGSRRSLYRKRVHLDGDFYFSLVGSPVKRRGTIAGFGLAAERETVPTGSWEWFDIGEGQERATKLQEDGELRIELEMDRAGDWDVGYTEFLTDVSLRMEPEGGAGWRDSEPRWRVRITEGSRVSWPPADEAPGKA